MAPGGFHSDHPHTSPSSSSKVEEEEKESSSSSSSSSSRRNGDGGIDAVGMDRLGIGDQSSSINGTSSSSSSSHINTTVAGQDHGDNGGVQITCLSEVVDDLTLHFQIIRLHKQIYAWIGCNSAKFGNLYAAAPTRPNNAVCVTSLLGGTSDNIGSGIARRLVLKTGLNIILACNIPKDSPMIEAGAEKKLVQILINLGYTRPKTKDHLNSRG